MIKNINILNPIFVEFESNTDSVMYFVDPIFSKVYTLTGELVPEEVSNSIFENLYGQQKKMMPIIPKKDIREVMQTEKEIEKENINHVFRRGQNARDWRY